MRLLLRMLRAFFPKGVVVGEKIEVQAEAQHNVKGVKTALSRGKLAVRPLWRHRGNR